ncbi:MAG TPA: C-GCAxxG-C-C family (seleno)protein [Blastocatellia bacterium]|nr:C-GCAxxG-C-C family (seleno)protein [Blastocatellia bacterium]
MKAGQIAHDLYLNEKVNSARSVLVSLRKARVIDFSDDLLLSATGFSRGLGNGDGLCGCVAAATMALGLRYGRDSKSDDCSRMTRDFQEEFRERYGSIRCGDLTRRFSEIDSPERRSHCANIVAFTAERLSEILNGEDVTIPSVRDLINLLNRIPESERTPDKIRNLVMRTHISEAEIEKCLVFSNEGYARNLFYKNEDFEVLVMCWKSGQKSPIHDHDNCLSVEKVFSGQLLFTSYHRVSEDQDEVYEGETIPGVPGDVADVAAGSIHKLENPSEFGSDAVTVHFYFPPLKQMKCFNIEDKTADWKKLGYLYIYNPNAWQSLNSCGM